MWQFADRCCREEASAWYRSTRRAAVLVVNVELLERASTPSARLWSELSGDRLALVGGGCEQLMADVGIGRAILTESHQQ
jgi:hypothetical protein